MFEVRSHKHTSAADAVMRHWYLIGSCNQLATC